MHEKHNCYNNILNTIGQTPMVKLNKVTKDMPFQVYAKLEFLNPMGSSKDRIAKYLIEQAEQNGELKPGDNIIENSSGNTAIGMALVAIQKGYKLTVVVRDTISKEKLDLLLSLGITIIKANTKLPPEHKDSYNNLAANIAKEKPNYYFPDQHNNRRNNEAHYNSTGPEIWSQMNGKVDFLIAGIGTGGTIGGVGKYLKEKNPNVQIIAIDIEGSVFTSYFHTGVPNKSKSYLLEGLGDEFIINCADFSVIDNIVQVSDKDSFYCAREIVLKEGILAGGSSGAVIQGLRMYSSNIKKDSNVAVIFPDGSSRYLSTIFNDTWMKNNNMLN